jgi:peptidoglycan/xylan/chitin deacetylase (PgdA/CDA1 family)
VGESAAGPRAALVGAVVALLLVSAATGGNPSHETPAAAVTAEPVTTTRPVPQPRPVGATVRSTATTRALPVAPPARPLPLPPGALAPVFSRLPIAENVVFLGIDDGAVRDHAVLDHLAELDIPFTNFLTMGPVQADPEFWRRAQAVGGTIQSHTMTHPDLTRTSSSSMRYEVCGTLDPYQSMFGVRPTLFRPPFGKLNDTVRRQAAACGYKAILLWKGSTNNGRLTMQEGPLQPGDVILLHWRDTLSADIDDVVARCRQEGFTIGRLEDYLSG